MGPFWDDFWIILGSFWDHFGMTFQIPIYFKRTYFMNHTNCLKLADFFLFVLICPIFIKDFSFFFQIKKSNLFLVQSTSTLDLLSKRNGSKHQKETPANQPKERGLGPLESPRGGAQGSPSGPKPRRVPKGPHLSFGWLSFPQTVLALWGSGVFKGW